MIVEKREIRTGADFANRIKSVLGRCMQRWRFTAVIVNAAARGSIVVVEFEGSGDAVRIEWDGRFKCCDVSGDYASRVEALLNGATRDEAGNVS